MFHFTAFHIQRTYLSRLQSFEKSVHDSKCILSQNFVIIIEMSLQHVMIMIHFVSLLLLSCSLFFFLLLFSSSSSFFFFFLNHSFILLLLNHSCLSFHETGPPVEVFIDLDVRSMGPISEIDMVILSTYLLSIQSFFSPFFSSSSSSFFHLLLIHPLSFSLFSLHSFFILPSFFLYSPFILSLFSLHSFFTHINSSRSLTFDRNNSFLHSINH